MPPVPPRRACSARSSAADRPAQDRQQGGKVLRRQQQHRRRLSPRQGLDAIQQGRVRRRPAEGPPLGAARPTGSVPPLHRPSKQSMTFPRCKAVSRLGGRMMKISAASPAWPSDGASQTATARRARFCGAGRRRGRPRRPLALAGWAASCSSRRWRRSHRHDVRADGPPTLATRGRCRDFRRRSRSLMTKAARSERLPSWTTPLSRGGVQLALNTCR